MSGLALNARSPPVQRPAHVVADQVQIRSLPTGIAPQTPFYRSNVSYFKPLWKYVVSCVRSQEGVGRIRPGDQRVSYAVDDRANEVLVVKIPHRSDFYE